MRLKSSMMLTFQKSLLVIYICGFAYGTYNLAVRKVTEDNVCVFMGSASLQASMSMMNAASFVVTYILLAFFNGGSHVQ